MTQVIPATVPTAETKPAYRYARSLRMAQTSGVALVLDVVLGPLLDFLTFEFGKPCENPAHRSPWLALVLPPDGILRPQRVAYPSEATPDIVLEIIHEPDIYYIRQPSARHPKYNPEGISLLCVRFELERARNLGETWPAQAMARQYWEGALNGDNPVSSREALLLLERRIHGLQQIVLPDDDQRAQFIKQFPAALVISPEHQDAVARWFYVQRSGPTAAWKKARKHLDVALGERHKAGTTPQYHVDAILLHQAYTDLCKYIRGLREQVSVAKTPEEVTAVFPDWGTLYTRPEETAPFVELNEMLPGKDGRRGRNLPAPRGDAMAFIRYHTGIGKSSVDKYLKKATSA